MRDIDGRAQQVAKPGAPIIAAAPTLRNRCPIHHADEVFAWGWGAGGLPFAYVDLAMFSSYATRAGAWRCVV